ncbi:hypothetical protein ACX40Y_05200 [Sphingomonas sp. RS6]
MSIAALMFALALPQDHFRGPIADDDGTGSQAVRDCGATGGDDIVVCRRAESDRLGALPPLRRRGGLPQAAVRVPGVGEARAEAQQHDTGFYSVPAAMLTLRIPLGGPKKKPAQDDQ